MADQMMKELKDGEEQIQLTGTYTPRPAYDSTGVDPTGVEQATKNQKIQQNPDYYIPKVYHEADEVCTNNYWFYVMCVLYVCINIFW